MVMAKQTQTMAWAGLPTTHMLESTAIQESFQGVFVRAPFSCSFHNALLKSIPTIWQPADPCLENIATNNTNSYCEAEWFHFFQRKQ